MTKQLLYTDFCVIGGGSGGLSFAAGAAQMDASVILLERHKMGGDCLNYGCIPSKALIAAAKFGHMLKEGNKFGWPLAKPQVNFQEVHNHVHSVIKAISPHDSVKRFTKLGVKVILAEARFLDEATVETDTFLIKAKRFIIATGSKPFIPPIDGLSTVSYYTNESIFDLTTLPEHLLIMGGGPIGIEMAQAFCRFGSKVTVLEAGIALSKDDLYMANKLKELLRHEGMEINENMQIASVKQTDHGVQVICKDTQGQERKIDASHLLIAAGRQPNIDTLNLAAAKVLTSPKGIITNASLQTSNSKIYALGDCVGGYQFTHVAGYHAGLAIRHSIFRLRTIMQTKAIPWVTYTDPELAHVGWLENQLQSQNIAYKVLQLDFEDNDRAQTERRTEGSIKVLVSPKGDVLGVTILGLHGGELIYPWVMAIQNKLKISAITNSIAPYPTLNDINKRVAGSFYTEKIFGANMKKIVKFIIGWMR